MITMRGEEMLFCFNLLVALASIFHRFSGFLAIILSLLIVMVRIWREFDVTPIRPQLGW